ncbi:hypothetical protein [Natrialba sp. SSL1]|uniref:hypothetical protein n=1 Tax=Natrialba sp. SSL1 TaxID=1869245 RepID=UPI0008F7EE02|nr:hypothetical protein [Natrialba sp. SSL1]OIB56147.1 hypothetical protein BBD46_19260 [Natrialba sp. SSL1]
MKDPYYFDDEDWINTLGRGDKSDFEDLFDEKYSEIDEDRAKASVKTRFERNGEPEHRLFRAIVDAFSPNGSAEGSDSGFETTIINPLYEFGQESAEILLAKKQVRSVHLCFVCCEIGGENYDKWRSNINKVESVLQSEGNRTALKNHLDCEGLDLKTVQYLTITRDRDLMDVDMDVLKLGTTPDNYAVWKLMESELPGSEDQDDEDQIVKHHDGNIEHPDLHEVAVDGLDYTLVDNDDIRFSLTSHPIFPLGDVFLQILLNQIGSNDHPDEFNKSNFISVYRDKIQLGENRDELDEVLDTKIREILQLACDADILQEEGEEFDTERDYRLVWDSDEPKDIKDAVREKYFKYKAPEQRGSLAFDRAKDEFERVESQLDGFGND